MATKLDRIARLEATRRPPAGGVLVQREGETVDDTMKRAQAAGRAGAFVVVPPALSSVDSWSAQCSAYLAQQQRDSATEIERLLGEARARS